MRRRITFYHAVKRFLQSALTFLQILPRSLQLSRLAGLREIQENNTTQRKSISSWIHETLENEKAHFKIENRQNRPKMVIFRPFDPFSSKCLRQAPGSLLDQPPSGARPGARRRPGAAPAPARRPAGPGRGAIRGPRSRSGPRQGRPDPLRDPKNGKKPLVPL